MTQPCYACVEQGRKRRGDAPHSKLRVVKRESFPRSMYGGYDETTYRCTECGATTVAYGDPYHPDVVFLRNFRDNRLSGWPWGRQVYQLVLDPRSKIGGQGEKSSVGTPCSKNIARGARDCVATNYLARAVCAMPYESIIPILDHCHHDSHALR